MIAEHIRLAETGAKLVELRLDCIRREVNLKRLLKDRPCPVVITCRRIQDGGQWHGTEEHRIMLLRAAIAEGVEYIDLEEDIAGSIPRFGKTQRIVSYHNPEKTPDDLAEIHRRMTGLDPNVIKLATFANRPADCVRMLIVGRGCKIPTVAFCMGDVGMATRILTARFGAPFSYAAASSDRTLAPGQFSFHQMAQVYGYDSIRATTEVFGVIADPVSHSLSPVVHNAGFRALGLDKVYVPFRVSRETLNEFLAGCAELGVKGLSVTIPHKEVMVTRCDRVDGAAKAVGAVNTVVWEGGEVHGFNTDYRAAMNCLDIRLNTESRKTPLAGHSALVLGAGGVARALAYGLKRRRADVIISSRRLDKAERLAHEMDARAIPWEQRHMTKVEVIVNCTPVGMHPNMDETPYDARYFRPNSIVFDTVYNPEQTLFFKQARERRCQVISGAEMFLGQAALQFKHFTGVEPPLAALEESFRRAIGAAQVHPE
jgi:3-dehydroquinate dehydratase / shikimate dehydrogenase